MWKKTMKRMTIIMMTQKRTELTQNTRPERERNEEKRGDANVPTVLPTAAVVAAAAAKRIPTIPLETSEDAAKRGDEENGDAIGNPPGSTPRDGERRILGNEEDENARKTRGVTIITPIATSIAKRSDSDVARNGADETNLPVEPRNRRDEGVRIGKKPTIAARAATSRVVEWMPWYVVSFLQTANPEGFINYT